VEAAPNLSGRCFSIYMAGKASIKPEAWTGGAAGFFRFLEEFQPMVPSAKGGFERFKLRPLEAEEIRNALESNARTIVLCWPRRHGKTLVSALLVIWRFLSSQTQTIGICANSAQQTIDTAFKTIVGILRETPYSADMIAKSSITILGDKISYDGLRNTIQGFPANAKALYGKKLTIAQVSELHAAFDDEAYQVLASSTIDSEDGLVLVDSTVGPRSSPLFALYSVAQDGTDPSLFYSHIFYKDLEDAVAKLPSWITEKALRSRAAQMLPAEFAQQHLNQWGLSSSSLFPPHVLSKCIETYDIDPKAIANGSAYVVGGGLDRAYGFSINGDATVTTCILKVLQGEEEHIYVLASDNVTFSSASGIRKNFQRYQREYGMKTLAIENYNSQDIAAWCGEQQTFSHEIVHPTAEKQASAFTALYQAANEGRLHIHKKFEKLLKEMDRFEYQISRTSNRTGGVPSFEAAKGSKDDHVYSLCWALYSLREQELNAYELHGIHCFGASPVVRMCALNGGEMIPPCASDCRSMGRAHALYKQYRTKNHLIPLDFPEFIAAKITNTGAHTLPR
jgi:hypothetical protein